MAPLIDSFCFNGAVRLHVLQRGSATNGTPSLVVSAGIWEDAERSRALFDRLDWPHVVSFSYRGRGLSDTPATGYDLEDHLGDLETVVAHSRAARLVMLGFSRGVGCAIAYTLAHPDCVAGLILVDQPPIQNHWEPGTGDFWKNLVYRGIRVAGVIRPAAIDGLEREARAVEFWDRLPSIACPTLIMRGVNAGHPIPSDLSQEQAERYLALLPRASELRFERSGHMIPDDEPERYAESVAAFLRQVASRAA